MPRIDTEKVSHQHPDSGRPDREGPARSIGTGQFVIGSSKVRPRVDEVFKRDEKLGIYMKLYNLGADEDTHKPVGEVEYDIVKKGSNEKIAT